MREKVLSQKERKSDGELSPSWHSCQKTKPKQTPHRAKNKLCIHDRPHFKKKKILANRGVITLHSKESSNYLFLCLNDEPNSAKKSMSNSINSFQLEHALSQNPPVRTGEPYQRRNIAPNHSGGLTLHGHIRYRLFHPTA